MEADLHAIVGTTNTLMNHTITGIDSFWATVD